MLRNIGGPEIILILVVVLLLFGATRLPALARSIGQSARELREGMKEGATEDEPSDAVSEDSSKPPNGTSTS